MPRDVFPDFTRRLSHYQSTNRNPVYLAVNYETDIFSFVTACYSENLIGTFGRTIAEWFRIPSQFVANGIEASEVETQQRIFSARRLAFPSTSSIVDSDTPLFTDFDFQILKRFKRLKEIILVLVEYPEIPEYSLMRLKDHPVCGGYPIISHLNDK